ncbi:DUF3575 domain-containing protein [Flavobacterium jejuense]|uniref:DUF3575 domain-containing protein n=1 Tax=Flavobacterium jejuense TaxID=1544455 RepID=A0ABX0IPA8_9FLAO|nr:DUF3575 domain-containing protein [Flavobacterium jejuense]NHN25640.1 DUF3575 domain-containing protein [Flavobacterium jejuense]
MNLSSKKVQISLLFLFLLSTVLFSNGQTNLKVNVFYAIAAVPNLGIETKLGKHTSFQIDVTTSFWESINTAPQKFVLLFPEFRYYTKEFGKGFYIGTHIGGGSYKLQKYNYWSTDFYQKGYNIMYGITTGYQFLINKKWYLEVFIGGGSSQGYYKGYKISTNERYDGADKFNKSGEWILYRGGLMLVYQL